MIKNKILILSPHTDDAELGAGGYISKLHENGCEILWVVFSTAEDSLPPEMPENTLFNEFCDVASEFGLKENQFIIHRYPVRHLYIYRQEILDILVEIRKKFNPDLVLGPSLNDYHQDHEIISKEMVRAFKMHCSILCYELPWNHLNFSSQFFVKLEERHINKKLQILKNYKSQIQLQRYYFSESLIRGIAIAKGAQIGYKFAESFDVVRWID